MITECKSLLMENARAWGMPAGGEWTFLFHNNYHSHHSNVNLLWFHNGSRSPVVVTKVFEDSGVPEREFQNLRQAHHYAGEWVPRPLHFCRRGRFWTLWLEGVPGCRIFRYSPAILQSMTAAVASMHAGMRNSNRLSEIDRHRRLVIDPLASLAGFGTSANVAKGCTALAHQASAEWLRSIPRIPQHGDLFVDNMLFDGRSWHVVDWESFGVTDLPFYDLFTLLLSLLGVGTQDPAGWAPALTAQLPSLILNYAQQLNLSTRDLPVIMPLSLANWFHLQLSDGRAEFAARMYKQLQHYFEHPEIWNRLTAV